MIPSSHRSETYGRRTVCCCVAVDAVGVAVCCCGADRLRASFNFRPWLGIVAGRYLAVHTVLRCTVLFHIHTSCTAILAHVPPQAHASTVYRRLRAGIPASQPPSPAHPQLSSPTLLLQPEHAAHAACIASTKDASGQWSAEAGGFVSHPPSHQGQAGPKRNVWLG